MITAQIRPKDIDRINASIARHVNLLGLNKDYVLMRTMRQIAKTGFDITPPGKGGGKRKNAQKKVEGDLDKALKLWDIEKMKNQKFKDFIEPLAEAKDYDRITNNLSDAPKFRRYKFMEFDESIHDNLRKHPDKIGVKQSYTNYTFDKKEYTKYLKELLKRVGSWKSIWISLIDKLNQISLPGDTKGGVISVPDWVRRNFSRYGSKYGDATVEISPDRSLIRAELTGPNIKQLQGLIDNTIKITLNKMQREFEYLAKKQLKEARQNGIPI